MICTCSPNDPWSFAAAYSRLYFINRSGWNSSLQYTTVLNIVTTVLAPFMHMFFPGAIHLCLRFIKLLIVVCTNNRMLFFYQQIISVHVLSCICVFLVTAMYAWVYYVVRGCEDVMYTIHSVLNRPTVHDVRRKSSAVFSAITQHKLSNGVISQLTTNYKTSYFGTNTQIPGNN